MVACQIISDETIDQLIISLQSSGGVAILNLPPSLTEVHKEAFEVATQALDISTNKALCPIIEPNSNSASVTGYHSADGDNALSRYNVHRQGFIFSNGEMFDFDFPIEEKTGANATNLSFEECMRDMFDSMCRVIASSVLRGIARYLKIEEDWFHEQYGPMDSSSQWHVKRYAEPDDAKILQDDQPNKESEPKEGVEWLPVHTDPSLISVVIHDAPGTNDNAMGLEYHALLLSPSSDTNGRKKERVWKEVDKHGHAVATIFCGSVMSYITGGVFQSAKHRVMYRPMETKSNNVTTRGGKNYRQAATLFLRPQGDSILTVPPSDIFVDRVVKIKNCKFQDWLNRVSKNYQGGQIKKNTKKEKSKKKKKVNTRAVIKSNPMYWTDTYTELSLHRCQDGDLSGKEKCQENKLSELNNHIYTMAGFAHRILVMDVSLDPPKLELIGPDLQADFKWSCGIPIDNIVYGIPCHSESVLKFNTLTKEINLLKWGESLPGACPHNQQWKYSCATVSNHDGCIYCIPQCAERVLKIDPKTDEMTFIGPAFPGVNKWSEGLLLNDGGIYGVCQNASGILRIDPETQQCTVHGKISEGHRKWHGAVKHTDGNIYCIPANGEQVLKVEPGIEPKLTLLGENIWTGTDHGTDYNTKYLGGIIGGDCVYFLPCDADYVCEVNTVTGKVREVGPNLQDHERIRDNKWKNGFTTTDGTIYGIPFKSETVLRIRPAFRAGDPPDITTIGGPYLGLNKWEGYAGAANGDMYCIPSNHKHSLRIRSKKQGEEKGARYIHGHATLRSSAHTLRHSKGRSTDPGPDTKGRLLPAMIRSKHIIAYDLSKHDLRNEVIRMLSALDSETIGKFRKDGDEQLRLENFHVPEDSLLPNKRTRDKNGKGEIAQRTLSDYVLCDVQFHQAFDAFVCEVILPELKERLIACGSIPKEDPIAFYYQRPPTLRIQPGPSIRKVIAHNDATYGHQDGELNFWMPLTDPQMTKTDLYCESSPGEEDYKPLGAQLGEIVSFHGSSCNHFVPPNRSAYTRVSLDFRVGVKPFFDPEWKLCGTKSDHTRKHVAI